MPKAKPAKAQPKAQDPVKVDAKHYKVEAQNKKVRVLRVTYGPGEKSVMHGHPASVGVFLTEGRAKFAFPNGKSEERSWKAGETMLMPAEQHLPENLTDKPRELILVEVKT
jgi:quercetin dioxygenase-like cupin family protein